MLNALLFFLLSVVSFVLIVLVLIQRGRGGGLVGALGGSGGSSAFGSRTGDVFTKITIYTACVWGALCMILVRSHASGPGGFAGLSGGTTATAPSDASKKTGDSTSGTGAGADANSKDGKSATDAKGAGTGDAKTAPPVDAPAPISKTPADLILPPALPGAEKK